MYINHAVVKYSGELAAGIPFRKTSRIYKVIDINAEFFDSTKGIKIGDFVLINVADVKPFKFKSFGGKKNTIELTAHIDSMSKIKHGGY